MNFKFPEIEEYFIYDPKSSYPVGGGVANMGTASPDRGIKIAKDAITYCTSGLVDRNKGTTLSYLNKAIKALNQLRMIEDSLVIYRLCLIGDTRVKTDTGYSYIKDLNVGDTVYAYDNRVDTLVKTQVTNKWMTGTKKHIQSNRSIIMSLEQKLILFLFMIPPQKKSNMFQLKI